jgi:hypothetical protein
VALTLSILYRGPLTSCNYSCGYCPFAKRKETRQELALDRQALQRFVGWVRDRAPDDRLGILFTPWGEALTRSWYRQALVELSHLPQVVRAVAQTNLSCDLRWVADTDRNRFALWTTYHPNQVSRARFLGQCEKLLAGGVRFSVGIVGLREHFAEIDAVRRALPPTVYLWVNAYKDQPDYYRPGEDKWLASFDPLFPINNRRHPSLGQSCRAGASAIAVDGAGMVRRCHFIPTVLGNLYETPLEQLLGERPCSRDTCGCHIGYIHLDYLRLAEVFGEGMLERIPQPLFAPLGQSSARQLPLPLL